MTVTNLWYVCSNWMPSSKVHIYSVSGGRLFDYTYFEDVLHDCGDSVVLSFMYNATTDSMTINTK